MEKYDVAIIGAGPAGSTLAHHMAKSGINTCIIDRHRFPRKKTCAGGLSPKVIGLIPFDITETIKNEISSIRLTHRMRNAFSFTYSKPLLHTVTRQEFDHFLLKKAVTANATFIEGETIHAISPTDNGYCITTLNKKVKAGIIVGADGTNGPTATNLALAPTDTRHLAIQIEVPHKKMPNDDCAGTTIALDWGYIKDGYAWLFPNGTHYLIGAMGHPTSARDLKNYLRQWATHLGLDPQDFQWHAHSIPHRISQRPITAERALLLGDAAGLADFWTGEGIYHAIRSANMAATHITRYLAGNSAAIRQYEDEINGTILPELKASYGFSRAFNYSHLAAFHAIKKYPYMWDLFCRIVRGDKSFSQVRKSLKPSSLAQKLFSKNKGTDVCPSENAVI